MSLDTPRLAKWQPPLDVPPPRLTDFLTLYWRLVAARARGQMQYKTSFYLATLATISASLTDFAGIAVIFSQVPQLAGWSLGEVALLYGLALTAFGIAETFSRGFDLFNRQILTGSFDRVLTRPLGAFFQILATDLPLQKLGRAAQGLVVFLIAARSLGIHWTLGKVLVLVVTVPSGAGIFASIFVIGAASSFWTVQANEAVAIFTNGGTQLLSYPLDIYHVSLRRFVTFVVPLAFVSYYPGLYLLDRPDPLGLPAWVGFLSPLAAVVCAALAWAIWSLGVRHYQSTGS